MPWLEVSQRFLCTLRDEDEKEVAKALVRSLFEMLVIKEIIIDVFGITDFDEIVNNVIRDYAPQAQKQMLPTCLN